MFAPYINLKIFFFNSYMASEKNLLFLRNFLISNDAGQNIPIKGSFYFRRLNI